MNRERNIAIGADGEAQLNAWPGDTRPAFAKLVSAAAGGALEHLHLMAIAQQGMNRAYARKSGAQHHDPHPAALARVTITPAAPPSPSAAKASAAITKPLARSPGSR